ncbi:NAD(P)-binding protein [Streptomyces sp. G3]|nr:NAD(P)-binding protein [Streptomyces sp. G3]
MRHRIAVIGGGPAGLAFARVLHRHDCPVTVLERESGPDARPPGGTLDLHEGLGQLALDKAGVLAEFRALSRPEGQAMRILDTDGTVLRDWRPGPDDRANPEIDRGQLRDLLLGPVDVRWGEHVTKVVPGGRAACGSTSRTDGRRRSTSWWARTAPGPEPARRSRR